MKAWLLLTLVGTASAMTDPTQPPPQLLAPRNAASAPGGAASAAVPAPVPLRLQGLREGDSALIDGRLRRVGERWQGYQLLRAEGQAAWLRDPDGHLLRLSLLPLTERRP